MKEKISTKNAPQAIGPYSQGVTAGELVFVSGQLPIDMKTGDMPNDIKAQAKESLTNIQSILKETNLTMDDIIKTTIFLADMDDFVEVNEVYDTFFNEPYPSRSTVEVAKLPKDAGIEIEAIAIKK